MSEQSEYPGTTLLQAVRIVAVGGIPAPAGVVDVRLGGGRVLDVAPELTPGRGEPVHAYGGRWLIPGLWDQHVHFGQWADTRGRIDLSGTTGPQEVLDRVQAHLAQVAPAADDLVVGFGYRSSGWSRPGSVAELDAAAGGRAVVLISGDAHNGWLSSAALRVLEVPPTDGMLSENDWFPVFARLRERPVAPGAVDAAYLAAQRDAAAAGVVGVVDLEWEPGFREWPARVERGLDLLRVRTGVYAADLDEAIAAGVRSGMPLHPSGLVTMGPLKVISDGSLNTRTAWTTSPYAGAHATCGAANLSLAELSSLIVRGRMAGLSAAVHAIGDAALEQALDAFAAADGASRPEPTRPKDTLEHVQLGGPGLFERMADMNLAASVQPAHLLDDRDVMERSWPQQLPWAFALNSMLAAGVEVRLGSDAPVSPLDPWLAMAAAVHRSADERPAWQPQEALTPAQALAASTDGAGTIRPGSLADLAVLEDDPLAPPADPAATTALLRAMSVVATYVGGRRTHGATAAD